MEIGAAGEQQAHQRRNVKAYAPAFVLGMMVGTFGLLAVQHAMAGEVGFLKNSFAVNAAPIKNGVQALPGVANQQGTNVGRSWTTMTDSSLEASFSSAMASSDGSACSRRNALAAAAGVAAASIGAPKFALAATVIKMGTDSGQLVYEPSDVTICKGDSVTWVNNKGGPHNVVFNEVPDGADADELGEGDMMGEPGQKHTATFKVAGAYAYYCAPHGGAGMVAAITVQ